MLWAASVSLLRSVGHILQKVDSVRDVRVKAAVDNAWSNWKADRDKHAIFFDFIEKERNAVLKQYEFGYQPGEVLLVASPVGGGEPTLAKLPQAIYAPLLGGPYEGEDARDVAHEVIEWWRTQLDEIEVLVHQMV